MTATTVCYRRIVRVGDVNLHSQDECEFPARCGRDRQDLLVQESFVHPAINISCEYGYAHNDICLLRLQHRIRFNGRYRLLCEIKFVRPVKKPLLHQNIHS